MADKLKMHSPDLTQGNIAKIREHFPGCVTEDNDENGHLRLVVDFDQLRQELSGDIVEGPQERYNLNWPGKRRALLAANAPIAKTLRPCRKESVDFDSTRNLFIEGDNLKALKLLQETYLGKIKMIYIDPPYNTGRNLIYKNNYSESTEEYLARSNQKSEDGERLIANSETNGRFHSDWLSMMYPRLKVARNLLRSDGVLVCAIDENEFATLSILIKEVFGEGGCEYGYVSVVHNPRGQQGTNFSYVNEYLIFVYPDDGAKRLADFKKNEVDSRNLRDSGTESDRTNAKNCFYPFIVQDGEIVDIGDVASDDSHPASANVKRSDGSVEVWPMDDKGNEKKWRYARGTVDEIREKLEAKNGRSLIQIIYHKDMGTMRSVWDRAKYDSSEYGTKLVDELMGGKSSFTYPKSLHAVYDAIYAATSEDKEAIIMDFFAGSGTTAHAIMKLNADDGGNRSFIAVQFPETIDSKEKPPKGLENIAEICKERIRKAGKEILAGEYHESWQQDVGFRVLKIDTSNMADVYYTPGKLKQENLSSAVSNIKPGRDNPEDLLFQVLVDWGIDLTLPVKSATVQGRTVFFVNEEPYDLVACFDTGITGELIKGLAGFKPVRAVFRDGGFASDADKINASQLFRQFSPETDVKSI